MQSCTLWPQRRGRNGLVGPRLWEIVKDGEPVDCSRLDGPLPAFLNRPCLSIGIVLGEPEDGNCWG